MPGGLQGLERDRLPGYAVPWDGVRDRSREGVRVSGHGGVLSRVEVIVRWWIAGSGVLVGLACGGGLPAPSSSEGSVDEAEEVAPLSCAEAQRHASYPDGPAELWRHPIEPTLVGGNRPLVPAYAEGMSMSWCETAGRPEGALALYAEALTFTGHAHEGKPVGRWVGAEVVAGEAVELWAVTFDAAGMQQGAFHRGWAVGDMGGIDGQFLDGEADGRWTWSGEGYQRVAHFERGLLHGPFEDSREEAMKLVTETGTYFRGQPVGVWTTTTGTEVTHRVDHGAPPGG